MNREDLLERIAAERQRRGMTQTAAAESYGCSVVSWNVIENGRKEASIDVLIRMATAVGLKVDLKVTRAKQK